MSTCLREFNEELYRKTLLEEGERLLAQLISNLLADKRDAEISIIVNDKNMRERLYQEYGLV